MNRISLSLLLLGISASGVTLGMEKVVLEEEGKTSQENGQVMNGVLNLAGRNLATCIAEAIGEAEKMYIARAKCRTKQHERRKPELAKMANDKSRPKWERDAARDELLREEQGCLREMQNFVELLQDSAEHLRSLAQCVMESSKKEWLLCLQNGTYDSEGELAEGIDEIFEEAFKGCCEELDRYEYRIRILQEELLRRSDEQDLDGDNDNNK